MTVEEELLRSIPSIDRTLSLPSVNELLQRFPRHLVVEEVRRVFREWRSRIREGQMEPNEVLAGIERLPGALEAALSRRLSPTLGRVINATGVILHTNIGRAPLSAEAAARMSDLATGYSNLEFDLPRKERGRREIHVETRLGGLLGCEGAVVCNNNAAAVFLILNTLAEGKEVVVSRGELVEIGGSFRIPDIMARSQALLREVGTTNKTRLNDYRQAVCENTGLILRVHPSNYTIIGFTCKPALSELVKLAHDHAIPLVEDVGSGLLFPSSLPFLQNEPSVLEALEKGVDLVCFSGDKLLGGPQCGIVVGRSALIERIRRNPLMRVVRIDKVTAAALEQTLIEYEKGGTTPAVPIHRMLSTSVEEMDIRSRNFLRSLEGLSCEARLSPGFSLVGGGSAPSERIPTLVIRLRSESHSAPKIERHLRLGPEPILARLEEDEVLLDLRTVLPGEEPKIVACLKGLFR